MGRMSLETRRRVINLYQTGMKFCKIRSRLQDEGITVSRVGIWKLIKKYLQTGSVLDRPKPKPSSLKKLKLDDLCTIDDELANDDQLSITEVLQILSDKGVKVSRSVIQRAKKDLGNYISVSATIAS